MRQNQRAILYSGEGIPSRPPFNPNSLPIDEKRKPTNKKVRK